MRRAAHTGLHKVVVNLFQPQQTAEATLLIKDIIKDPGAWDSHVRRWRLLLWNFSTATDHRNLLGAFSRRSSM